MTQSIPSAPDAHSLETAASLMRQDFLSVSKHLTVEQAIRELAKDNIYHHFYQVYLLDNGQQLSGAVDLKELICADPDKRLHELPVSSPVTVNADLDQEEVAEIVSRHNLVELPVVDSADRLLGVISVDDVVDVLIQEHTEDIFKARGVEHAPLAGRSLRGLSIMQLFYARMPWLLLSLGGGLIAGAIIHGFQVRLEALIIALVIFIPFIMALGGNVGSQSATIFVRELALDSIEHVAAYFVKEIAVGLLIGVSLGAIVGIVAWMWQGSGMIGWIVGLASVGVSLAGVLIGTFIPWIFDRVGFDTALSSGPIVTTLKDITGLLIYFGIAMLVIRIAGL